MNISEMKTIAGWIVKTITDIGSENSLKTIKEEVAQMCAHFPVPGIDY